jgi:hypothetical protein
LTLIIRPHRLATRARRLLFLALALMVGLRNLRASLL